MRLMICTFKMSHSPDIHHVTNICDAPVRWRVTDVCDGVNTKRNHCRRRVTHIGVIKPRTFHLGVLILTTEPSSSLYKLQSLQPQGVRKALQGVRKTLNCSGGGPQRKRRTRPPRPSARRRPAPPSPACCCAAARRWAPCSPSSSRGSSLTG